MSVDDSPFLLGFFWYGFSLTFVAIVWYQRISPQFKSHVQSDIHIPSRVSRSVRVFLALFGVLGAVGAAAFVGRMRGLVPGVEVALLIGLASGVWIALQLGKTPSTTK